MNARHTHPRRVRRVFWIAGAAGILAGALTGLLVTLVVA